LRRTVDQGWVTRESSSDNRTRVAFHFVVRTTTYRIHCTRSNSIILCVTSFFFACLLETQFNTVYKPDRTIVSTVASAAVAMEMRTLYSQKDAATLLRLVKWFTHAQYTPPTPTRLSCRVESRRRRRCAQNSQLAHDDCRRIWSATWKLTKQTP